MNFNKPKPGNFFETQIEFLKGVGPQRARVLNKELELFTFNDLVHHYPFRYVDRTKIYKIKEINDQMPYIQLKGKIVSVTSLGKQRATRLVAQFRDETGTVELVWFRGIKWMRDTLKAGIEYIVFGKPALFQNKINIVHPEMEVVSEAAETINKRLQPFYNTTEKSKAKGIDSRAILRWQRKLAEKISFQEINETLPEYLITELKLISLKEALTTIHFPPDTNELRKAQFRLKFEEFFYLQVKLLKLKLVRTEKYKGKIFSKVGDQFNYFYHHRLPFQLTNAQKKVLKELRKDLGSGKQMNRLLQGDVGSGKTLVALMSILLSIDNSYQACMMAPTEILARQHFETIKNFLGDMKINVELLTGSTKNKERKQILENLKNNTSHILIGTHALIEDDVHFNNLGLVVIDEQHRFGVEQRARLWMKRSPSPTLPERKGEQPAGFSNGIKDVNTKPVYGYQTARNSSYDILKLDQQELKKGTTEAEEILWNYLKGKNLEQFKFRRQHIIDEFIVDFICLSKKIIVEIDGGYPNDPKIIEADNLRTGILKDIGFKVIRFSNEEVLVNIEKVLKKIKQELSFFSGGEARVQDSLSFGEGRGEAPHVLVMTATPIPRTLAMTLYGDLDVSVIDELPPGRKHIKTVHYFESKRLLLFGFLKEQVKLGRQIYIVYPLIEESEKMDYNNLMEGFEAISREFPIPQYKVSIVHGRMKSKDKDYEMKNFAEGKTNIMVATTVIEVGVDVPNASVMIIESAERFGLSQLHQLRGRVGRGAEQSYCILMTGSKLSHEARQRLETMVRTNDGFEIAETDLKLRGPGELSGTQQSGIVGLKIADLSKDTQILDLARKAAIRILENDPRLALPQHENIFERLSVMEKDKTNWSRVS
ncbi:MAG TPA: DUF559 domain-containing protein [Bacteroidia bacterium]|nr:DUF559 domain-containing protein [Bacteroidia bacterium]